jgi:hypothetical protein
MRAAKKGCDGHAREQKNRGALPIVPGKSDRESGIFHGPGCVSVVVAFGERKTPPAPVAPEAFELFGLT